MGIQKEKNFKSQSMLVVATPPPLSHFTTSAFCKGDSGGLGVSLVLRLSGPTNRTRVHVQLRSPNDAAEEKTVGTWSVLPFCFARVTSYHVH